MPSRSNRFTAIARAAAEKTNAMMADDLAKLTPLTADEIARLLPTKQDKEKVAELLAIVSQATSHNQRVAKFKRNVDQFGSVAIKLLRKVLV